MRVPLNTNIFTLPSPRVLYSYEMERLILQTGAMYVSSGAVEVDDDTLTATDFDSAYQSAAPHILIFPIDEDGIVWDDGDIFENFFSVGHPGDTISQLHPAILEYLKQYSPNDIPAGYRRVKEQLRKYRIEINEEKVEELSLDVRVEEKSDEHTIRLSTRSMGLNHIPFRKSYPRDSYSDERLAEDIMATMSSFFTVFPVPERVKLHVEDIDGWKMNGRILEMVAKAPDLPCKIVAG